MTTTEKYKNFMREYLGIEVDGSETIADIELIVGQINTPCERCSMKTIRQEIVKKVVHVKKFLPIEGKLEQGVIYISEYFGCSIHLCFCGCGVECFLPIGENDWTFTENNNGKLTITPSVLQTFACKSHYIITDSKVNFV